MLKLDQDEFITQFVTTFLATWAADHCEDASRRGTTEALKHPPVEDAIWCARMAWMNLIAYGTPTQMVPPPQSATPAPELTDAQRHPRVMPKGEFEFDR